MFRIILVRKALQGYWFVPGQCWNSNKEKASQFTTREQADSEAVHARDQIPMQGCTVKVVEVPTRETLILTEAEAVGVYDAMCHLNNVGGILHARLLQEGGMTKHVEEYLTDEVRVYYGDGPKPVGTSESYTNQDAFAKAYGIK